MLLSVQTMYLSMLTYCLVCCNSRWNPTATSRQNPILGVYSTRSATTKPTGKNRFEAGI